MHFGTVAKSWRSRKVDRCKIWAGSDLRHDVRQIYIYIEREREREKIYSKLVYVGLAQARPN